MCCNSWGRKESDMTERLNCPEGKMRKSNQSIIKEISPEYSLEACERLEEMMYVMCSYRK